MKALASFFIAGCLGVQTFEIWRPHDGKLWPFLDYPMYSRSFQPGTTFRTYQLRADSCDTPPRRVPVRMADIGYLGARLRGRLSAIATDRASAVIDRAALSRVVAAHVRPRPCVLQVWERQVTTTPDGVDPEVFARPRWTLRRAWPLDRP